MEREFYFVTKRVKVIIIKWAVCKIKSVKPEKYRILDWEVEWKKDFLNGNKMIVNIKGNEKEHTLIHYSEQLICLYPHKSNKPFVLQLATKEKIEKQTYSYEGSCYTEELEKYYNKLFKFVGEQDE